MISNWCLIFYHSFYDFVHSIECMLQNGKVENANSKQIE